MFFDEPLQKRKDARIYQPPAVPETGWKPLQPDQWPNLSGARYIAYDTETKDLGLIDRGPGWARGDAHIVGISMCAEANNGERIQFYLPMRHEFDTSENLDPVNVLRYVGHHLAQPCDKVGANLTYDNGNLQSEGVTVNGRLFDVQYAEALLDNEAEVALEELAHKYLNTSKVTTALYDWISKAYPNTPPKYYRRDIYRSPARLVGPYAEGDASLPLDVWKQQERSLHAQDLDRVFRMECDLIPMMLAMRHRGIRVDLDYAQRLYYELLKETPLLFDKVRNEFGYTLLSTSTNDLAKFFEYVGIKVPRTPEGNYSVRKEWLAGLEHPAGEIINLIREHEKICGTFIKSYMLEQNTNGYLFPQFHQLHGDTNGTKVGRFASSNPNLQNIPSRTKLGKRVRQAFVPDKGAFGWRKFDYSQVHYRLLANLAVDKGDGSAEALRERYRNDPKTDYHMDVYRNVAPLLGWNADYQMIVDANGKEDWNEEIKIKRRPIKNVNFGLLYGQSSKSLAYKAGFTPKQAEEFFKAYHAGAPYVSATMEEIGKEVQAFGYVTTLMGRRIRFPLWEPIKKDWDNPNREEDEKPLEYDRAIRKWGAGIKRAFEYRGVNYKLQGSEPDLMKPGMLACWNSGVFREVGVPMITVHDELDFSVWDNSPRSRECYDFIQHTMENTTKLRIPIFVDESNGPNWGKCD